MSQTTLPAPDRLTAVDLTDLPDTHAAALRREAIRRGCSMAELVASLVHEASARLVLGQPTAHHLPQPEGRN